jgi:hypothetical protein
MKAAAMSGSMDATGVRDWRQASRFVVESSSGDNG